MGNFYPFSVCHCTRGYVKRRRTLFGRPKDTCSQKGRPLPPCQPASPLSGVVRRLCRRLHPIWKSQDLVEAIPTALENRTPCAGAIGADFWELQFQSKDFKPIARMRAIGTANLFSRDPTIWCYPKQIKNQPATFVLEPPCARCVFPRGRPSQFSVNSQWFHV